MIRKTTSTLIRTTIVWFTILFSILGPLSDSIVADICRAEPLRLTLTAAALQDIQFRWGTFDEAMRVARALRWEIPIGEQKVPAFTALDQADASIFWMGRQMYALQLTATVTDVILKIILESVRENRVRLEAAVAALQDGTAQKTALKQKLNEAGGYLLELTQSLNEGYRSAAWGNVNQLDRQVTVPRRITLLDSKPASLTLEAPVGGAVRVNIACEPKSGGPLQVSAQLRRTAQPRHHDTLRLRPLRQAAALLHAHTESTFNYDAVGRTLSETVDGRTIAYTYDLLGRRTARHPRRHRLHLDL